MNKIKIAVQKSGRLSENSLDLFKECGIRIPGGSRKLKADAINFPAEFLFLRDDDIPQYVEQGIADIGIIGENEVWEQDKNIEIVQALGFAECRMSLAVPREQNYEDPEFFRDKIIATSYPNILKKYFQEKAIPVKVEQLSGSVEIATGIGLASGIFDIVSSGSTLMQNGLKEVEVVNTSQAVLIKSKNLSDSNQTILEQIIFRIQAVKEGRENRYILLNTPNTSIEAISKLIPGMKAPTILPLPEEGWSSLHSVIRESDFWEIIDRLKNLGAEGILVLPIEKMIL